MSVNIDNPYFRNEVLTAGPEKLRLLLLEGCVRFLRDGRSGLESKDFERVFESFTQARAILVELISTMKVDVDPDLCQKVASLYTYVMRLTMEGSHEKDLAKIDEAIELMEYEVQTWSLLIDKVGQEKRTSAPEPAALRPTGTDGVPPMPRLSVEG